MFSDCNNIILLLIYYFLLTLVYLIIFDISGLTGIYRFRIWDIMGVNLTFDSLIPGALMQIVGC